MHPETINICPGKHMGISGATSELRRYFFQENVRYEETSKFAPGADAAAKKGSTKKERAIVQFEKPGHIRSVERS